MQNTVNKISSYNKDQIVYKNFPVDELPAIISDEICKILNQQSKWKELAAKHLQWDTFEVQNVDKQKNPMKEFMRQLGILGYGVNELYCILYKMGHYLGMQVLQVCVDEKYHHLMNKANDNLSNVPKAKVQCVPICPNKMIGNNENNQTNEEKILNQGEKITPRPVAPSNSNNLDVKSPSLTNLIILKPSMTLPQMIEALKPTYLQNLSYKLLTDATDNWNDAKIIGKGGFGKVFKGSWINTDVAIKRLEKTNVESDKYIEDFKGYLGEISSGASCRHDTLLPIYAYSMTDGKPSCIVYQIMANGSLEDRLALKDNTPALNWLQRHNIAKFVAQGLQFMHSHHEKPLIHRDIKSANILLDANMNPKIGDFGLARRINNKEGEKVDKLQGTKIYLPLDYLNGKILSPKVDTYSYGCVMYELATGLRYDQLKNNAQYKRNPDNDKFNGLIDQKAGHQHNLVFENLIEVGNKCTQSLPKDRPYMDEVYNSLVESE